jgi:hypothetical protein
LCWLLTGRVSEMWHFFNLSVQLKSIPGKNLPPFFHAVHVFAGPYPDFNQAWWVKCLCNLMSAWLIWFYFWKVRQRGFLLHDDLHSAVLHTSCLVSGGLLGHQTRHAHTSPQTGEVRFRLTGIKWLDISSCLLFQRVQIPFDGDAAW